MIILYIAIYLINPMYWERVLHFKPFQKDAHLAFALLHNAEDKARDYFIAENDVKRELALIEDVAPGLIDGIKSGTQDSKTGPWANIVLHQIVFQNRLDYKDIKENNVTAEFINKYSNSMLILIVNSYGERKLFMRRFSGLSEHALGDSPRTVYEAQTKWVPMPTETRIILPKQVGTAKDGAPTEEKLLADELRDDAKSEPLRKAVAIAIGQDAAQLIAAQQELAKKTQEIEQEKDVILTRLSSDPGVFWSIIVQRILFSAVLTGLAWVFISTLFREWARARHIENYQYARDILGEGADVDDIGRLAASMNDQRVSARSRTNRRADHPSITPEFIEQVTSVFERLTNSAASSQPGRVSRPRARRSPAPQAEPAAGLEVPGMEASPSAPPQSPGVV